MKFNNQRDQFSDWNDSLWGLTLPQVQHSFLAVDIKEDDANITVKADLPGLNKEEIHVSLEDDVLIIRGERKSEGREAAQHYSRIERFVGTTERRFALGSGVDQAKITGSYKDGVLELVLPKSEASKPRRIEIKE